MSTPDYNQWLRECWGWPDESAVGFGVLAAAANIVYGQNPAWSIGDLLAFYPNNFLGVPVLTPGVTDGITGAVTGVPTSAGLAIGAFVTGANVARGVSIADISHGTIAVTGDVTTGSLGVVNVSSVAGILVGQPIVGAGIQPGTTVAAVGTNTIMLSLAAVETQAAQNLTITTTTLTLSAATTGAGTTMLAVYSTPFVPPAVLNAYIFLASDSVLQARWGAMWGMAMALYVAHFATLWMRASVTGLGGPPTTAAQAASLGLARGILVSKSADGVSGGYTPTPGLEDWGAWNLTEFGQLFATYAKTVGSGSMLIY